MMTGAEVFVDTNIPLRMIPTQMNQHAEVDMLMKRIISKSAQLRISGQVIREFNVDDMNCFADKIRIVSLEGRNP
jgi:hypothetical protein